MNLRALFLLTLFFLLVSTAFAQWKKDIKILEASVKKIYPGIPDGKISNEYLLKIVVLKTNINIYKILVGVDSIPIRIFKKEQLLKKRVFSINDTLSIRYAIFSKGEVSTLSECPMALVYEYKKKKKSSCITQLKMEKNIYLP